jgi:hypothetical protein
MIQRLGLQISHLQRQTDDMMIMLIDIHSYIQCPRPEEEQHTTPRPSEQAAEEQANKQHTTRPSEQDAEEEANQHKQAAEKQAVPCPSEQQTHVTHESPHDIVQAPREEQTSCTSSENEFIEVVAATLPQCRAENTQSSEVASPS